MDQEHRRTAGYREIIVGEEGEETTYVVRVSGNQAELVRGRLMPSDNEHGTGPDEDWESWGMDLDTLKKLIEQAQIVIRQENS